MSDLVSNLADIAALLAASTTVLLAIGCGLMVITRSPIHRQRIGELTLITVLAWLILAFVPLPRWISATPNSPNARASEKARPQSRRITPGARAGNSAVQSSDFPDTATPARSKDSWAQIGHTQQFLGMAPVAGAPSTSDARPKVSVEGVDESSLESLMFEYSRLTHSSVTEANLGSSRDLRQDAMVGQSTERQSSVKSDRVLDVPDRLDLPGLLATTWLVGIAACVAWLVLGHFLVASVRVSGGEPPRWLAEIFDELAQSCGHTRSKLIVSRRCPRPFSCGTWAPRIVLPVSLCRRSNEALLRTVLLHELGHVVQRDAWGNALVCISFPLLYVHPLFWWLRWRIRMAAELVVDDWAARLTGKERYVEELVAYARISRGARALLPGSTGIMTSSTQFYRRMQMLLAREQTLSTRTSSFWRWSTLLTFAAVIAASSLLAGVRQAPAGQDEANAVTEEAADVDESADRVRDGDEAEAAAEASEEESADDERASDEADVNEDGDADDADKDDDDGEAEAQRGEDTGDDADDKEDDGDEDEASEESVGEDVSDEAADRDTEERDTEDTDEDDGDDDGDDASEEQGEHEEQSEQEERAEADEGHEGVENAAKVLVEEINRADIVRAALEEIGKANAGATDEARAAEVVAREADLAALTAQIEALQAQIQELKKVAPDAGLPEASPQIDADGKTVLIKRVGENGIAWVERWTIDENGAPDKIVERRQEKRVSKTLRKGAARRNDGRVTQIVRRKDGSVVQQVYELGADGNPGRLIETTELAPDGSGRSIKHAPTGDPTQNPAGSSDLTQDPNQNIDRTGRPEQRATLAAGSAGQLDLVNLATSYADAVGAVEEARAELGVLEQATQNVPNAIPTSEVMRRKVAVKRAERKQKLLRRIAEVATAGVKAEVERLTRLYEAGAATASDLTEAQMRLEVLNEILSSDRE